MGEGRCRVRAIGHDDGDAVADFLHTNLDGQVERAVWKQLVGPPWGSVGPNNGFLAVEDERIVGVYAAVYSERRIEGELLRVCNLAAFCVLETHRTQSLRLVRALLNQAGFVFTDLSPSGNVVAMNERLGFERLPTSTRLTLNLPTLPRRGVRVTDDPRALDATLLGEDRRIYQDHRSADACRHLLVQRGDRYAYVVFRADARKGMRLFAAPLLASGDRVLLRRAWPAVASHLLMRHGLPFTLAERRILGFARGVGRELAHARPRMARGERADRLDYMYSELALVQW